MKKCDLCKKSKEYGISFCRVLLKNSGNTIRICQNCKLDLMLVFERDLTLQYEYKTEIKIMIIGRKDYHDINRVFKELDYYHSRMGIKKIYLSNAGGANDGAITWAMQRCVPYKLFKKAKQMINKTKPAVCLSFEAEGKLIKMCMNKKIETINVV